MSLIVKIGADTRAFDRRMAQLTSDITDITDKMRSQGEAMSTALSAPLAAIGVAAGMVASSFDDAQGMIQAQLGLTADEAEKLQDTAQNLWEKGFGENIGDAANQVAKVSQNMKQIDPSQLGEVSEQAMTVAKVFEQDINDVTKTANQLMTVFGMSATDAFDMMTKGFQNGMDFSGEFLDTLNEYAPQFDQLGFSGEQMFNTLASGASDGAFSMDKVGDAVKEFNIRAKDGSDTTAEAFKALGMDADKMSATFAKGGPEAQKSFIKVVQALSSIKDPLKQNQIGVQLFGTQFEDLGPDVVSAMSLVSDSIHGVEGATARAGEAVKQSMGQRFQSAFREAQSALEPLGEVLLNVAEVLLPKLSAAIEGVSKWFSNLSPETQTFIITLGGILAAAGPVLVVMANFIQALAVVKAAFIAVGVASWGAIGIWVAVGIAVAVLVAAIIIYWDQIVAATSAAWGWIKDFLSGLWDGIVSVAKTVWGALTEFFSGLWTGIKDVTSTIWNAIKDFFAEWGLTIIAVLLGPIGLLALAIYKNWDSIKAATETVWNAIKGFLSGLWNGLVAIFGPIFNGIVTIVTTVWNAVSTVTSAVWNFIKQYLIALWTALMYFVQPVLNKIGAFFTNVWNSIKSVSTTVWNAIKSFLTSAWNAISSVATSVWNKIKAFFTTWLNAVKSVMTTIWNAIKSAVITVWNAIKSTATSVWNAIKNAVMGPVNSTKSAVSNAFNSLKSSVSSIFNSVKSVASSVWNSIYSSVSSIVNRLVGGVKSAFNGMKSAVLGVWNGIKSGMRSVINGIISMVNKFIGGFNAPARALNKIPGVKAPTIPKIPMLATGGTIFGNGQAIVGEAGPELVSKSGSSVKVTPLSSQEKSGGIGGALGGSGGGVIEVPVIIDGREIARATAPFMDSQLRGRRDSTNRARGGW